MKRKPAGTDTKLYQQEKKIHTNPEGRNLKIEEEVNELDEMGDLEESEKNDRPNFLDKLDEIIEKYFKKRLRDFMKQKEAELRPVSEKIERINHANLPVVILPSPAAQDYQEFNNAQFVSEITNKLFEKNINYSFFINNGDNVYGHWDLINKKGENKEQRKIKCSPKGNACCGYALIQFLGTLDVLPDNVEDAFKNMAHEEAEMIRRALYDEEEERVDLINVLEPKIIRNFFRAAIEIFLNKNPNLTKEVRDWAEGAMNRVVAAGYQIELEELQRAMEGLVINFVNIVDLKSVSEPVEEEELENYKKNLINKLLKNGDSKEKESY